jgi:hypothetical protein
MSAAAAMSAAAGSGGGIGPDARGGRLAHLAHDAVVSVLIQHPPQKLPREQGVLREVFLQLAERARAM